MSETDPAAGSRTQCRPDFFSETQSVCPECLTRVNARRIMRKNTVFLEKECPVHGRFSSRIWQGEPAFETWIKPKIPIENRFKMTAEKNGCPFDCGLCPAHRQQTCTAVLEVTGRCNFDCTFCFASSGSGRRTADPSFQEIEVLLKSVYRVSPGCNLQISGGEATLRKDLPDIIRAAENTGFEFIQLNTNGFLAVGNPSFALNLKQAGLSSVFLQFDGVSDHVYSALRGRALADEKQQAVNNFADAGIGVILVPTLVPGVNLGQIGPILEFALSHAPGVRGVHFQPVSYFGRHQGPPADTDRLTIPEILREIQSQTKGKFRVQNFHPPSCEHALCSFNGKFIIWEDNRVTPLTGTESGCCPAVRAERGAERAVSSVARQWSGPRPVSQEGISDPLCCGEDDMSRFIRRSRTHLFTVSGMAFQDAWNLDLERLKGCCIHSVAPDGRLIPFCAYNLTSRQGKGLYRHL